MPRSCSSPWKSERLGWFTAAGDQLLLLLAEKGERRQGKPSPLCPCIPCPAWGCCAGLQPPRMAVKCQRSGIASWLLCPCPGRCFHGPATCCQSRRACTDPSVGTELAFSACFAVTERFSPSAEGRLPTLPAGTAVQAAFVPGSHALQTHIALLGVHFCFFLPFFFQSGVV